MQKNLSFKTAMLALLAGAGVIFGGCRSFNEPELTAKELADAFGLDYCVMNVALPDTPVNTVKLWRQTGKEKPFLCGMTSNFNMQFSKAQILALYKVGSNDIFELVYRLEMHPEKRVIRRKNTDGSEVTIKFEGNQPSKAYVRLSGLKIDRKGKTLVKHPGKDRKLKSGEYFVRFGADGDFSFMPPELNQNETGYYFTLENRPPDTNLPPARGK